MERGTTTGLQGRAATPKPSPLAFPGLRRRGVRTLFCPAGLRHRRAARAARRRRQSCPAGSPSGLPPPLGTVCHFARPPPTSFSSGSRSGSQSNSRCSSFYLPRPGIRAGGRIDLGRSEQGRRFAPPKSSAVRVKPGRRPERGEAEISARPAVPRMPAASRSSRSTRSRGRPAARFIASRSSREQTETYSEHLRLAGARAQLGVGRTPSNPCTTSSFPKSVSIIICSPLASSAAIEKGLPSSASPRARGRRSPPPPRRSAQVLAVGRDHYVNVLRPAHHAPGVHRQAADQPNSTPTSERRRSSSKAGSLKTACARRRIAAACGSARSPPPG